MFSSPQRPQGHQGPVLSRGLRYSWGALGLGQTSSSGLRVATLRGFGVPCRSDSQHRFWKPSEVEEEVDSAHVSEMLHSRHITFAGKFEPVQHQCRALKPNGRLCERQDRLKVRMMDKAIGVKL